MDALVAEALSEGERLHIDDVVLCELVWVLRGAYRTDKPAIVSALEKILSTALFSFEDRDVLRRVVEDYRKGGGDFADYLIGRGKVPGHGDLRPSPERRRDGYSNHVLPPARPQVTAQNVWRRRRPGDRHPHAAELDFSGRPAGDPGHAVVNKDDVEMLHDVVVAAFNEAFRDKIGPVTAGLQIRGLR